MSSDFQPTPLMSEAFDRYYASVYQDRWPELRAALMSDKRQVKRRNRFAVPTDDEPPTRPIDAAPNCYPNPSLHRPLRTANGLFDYYMMDLASVIVANALEVEPNDRVLDLCAAPGGKSLILAEQLGPNGELTANERSAARRFKLKDILANYLPDEARARVRITGHDASKWGTRERDVYDRVLVDAPCSSERHVIGSPEMSHWKASRTKQMAVRQYAILCSALLAVKPGGRIVYSTCSISPYENDHVIERLLKRKHEHVEVARHRPPLGEPTARGWQIMPDRSGYGPMYFAVLRKRE